MVYVLYGLISLLPILVLVACGAFIFYAYKKGAFKTECDPQIAMREGEVSILATRVVWMRQSFYTNRRKIPQGVLDITNQRVVYTRLMGEKVSFALEKDQIDSVSCTGKIRVTIRAKDGAVYALNTTPAQTTLAALEKMGLPVRS